MKLSLIGIIGLSLIILSSCATSKIKRETTLENTLWELEFITETNDSMKRLFPVDFPSITLQESSKRVNGTDGCNGYSSEYTLSGNTLSFGEPGPATLRYCGEGDNLFRNALKKTNNYAIDKDGNLNFLMDNIPLLRFRKVN